MPNFFFFFLIAIILPNSGSGFIHYSPCVNSERKSGIHEDLARKYGKDDILYPII